ncbi:hypothetical protein ANRL1_03381 [Anaerolineae bacterium]|nr:hypothetical protein ANRL1_03381 [Anaerolineae bacterium]
MAVTTKEEMKNRTKKFALRVIRMSEALPRSLAGKVIGSQALRSGTSVGANYRAVCRARSEKDFVNKLGVVLEESDETAYWIELIVEANLLPPPKVTALLKEANELTAIFTASHKTANLRLRRKNRKSEIENRK